MAVVLVSRGSMSGGQMIAACLTRKGDFTCITREDLLSTVNEYGGIGAQLTAKIGKASRDYERFATLRRPYRILMKKALLDFVQRGDLAYFGYSGHLLLEKAPHLVRVRLNAPMALRLKLTMERLGCGEEEARDYVHEADEARTGWARFMYGADIRDPAQYDVCLNTPESVERLEDSRVATGVLAALVTSPDTTDLELAATFHAGRVLLEGPYLEPEELSRVEGVVRSLPGVNEVAYEPGYAPSFLMS